VLMFGGFSGDVSLEKTTNGTILESNVVPLVFRLFRRVRENIDDRAGFTFFGMTV
jgi:hypothetical protein